MAQLTDDCFAYGGRLLSVDEAVAELECRLTTVAEIETLALTETVGRILAEDVRSERSVPPHDNAAVDGYAVFFDDLCADAPTRLPVTGRIAAGHPLGRTAARGEAVRVFTGAAMPSGPDTVLMQEDCRCEGDVVELPAGIRRGANLRRAGEDVAAGSIVLRAGRRLRPPDVGLAASIGRRTLAVRRRLRVALFSTGDEVREPGQGLEDGGIYDANRYCLAGLLSQLGCLVEDLGILPDRLSDIAAAMRQGAAAADLVLTSGGVSGGDEDHVKQALEASGGRLHAWRLAIKPGRPVALGQLPAATGPVAFVGLPGNPVAVLVTFLFLARPLILRLAGAAAERPRGFPVRAGFAYSKKRQRREYVRVTVTDGADGMPVAVAFPKEGAGILTSVVESDGLVELPEELVRVERGALVAFLPYAGFW